MRSQEFVARPQVEQRRETLHRERVEAVLIVGGQGSVARTLAEHGKARQPAHRHRRQEASRASRAQPTP